MYIGFLNDQKELNLLIQQEKILCVKTRKGRKRKYVTRILLVTVLAFGPLNASAKPIDYNKTTYETVISKDFSRGGFSARPVNMETLGRHLSQEYKDYQQKRQPCQNDLTHSNFQK